VIAVAIVTVISITVFPVFSSLLRRIQLKSNAEEIAAHLRYGRKYAIENGRTVRFQFLDGEGVGRHRYLAKSYNPVTSFCSDEQNMYDPLDSSKDFNIVFVDPTGTYPERREFRGISFGTVQFASQGNPNSKNIAFSPTGAPYSSCDVQNQNQ